MVHSICFKCQVYQFLKRGKKKYGKLPAKQAETEPWNMLCVDVIDKYQITIQGGKEYKMTADKGRKLYLQALTMIDPATGQIEIKAMPSARADLAVNQTELAWLTHYCHIQLQDQLDIFLLTSSSIVVFIANVTSRQ